MPMLSPEQQEWWDDRSDETLAELCFHLRLAADPSCWKAADIIQKAHGINHYEVFPPQSADSDTKTTNL